MEEKIIENKVCKHCNSNFEITDKDLEFYEKVSPVFSGKKYLIPSPTLCPDCRQQRRLSWRNERKLYKRKCDATGKEIVSIYSPDKSYKVYNSDYWWSDNWNPLEYGKEFNFNKTFFEHFNSLLLEVPLLSLTALFDSENSDYVTFSGKLKDCYMISACWTNEKTMYSSRLMNTSSVLDSLDGTNLEQCYQTYNCEGCFSCFYCVNSHNCSNSYYLYDCSNCDYCFSCYNLVGKKYHIENKEYSKDEYFKILEELKKEYTKHGWKNLYKIKSLAINKNLMIINSENSVGDNIKNCSNCYSVFHIERTQNCKYVENGGMICSNVYDGLGIGENFDLGYELLDTGVNAILTCFGITCYSCNSSFYNINCHNSSNLFGCIGLRNKSYCILNKQYSKEEYETLVPKIIEHMKKTGEWGEFFPSSISPFGYNETVAQEYFPITPPSIPPLTGEGSKMFQFSLSPIRGKMSEGQIGVFNWSTFEAPFPQVEKIIKSSMLPDDIFKIPDDILNWAIECETTKKPFRIIKQELEFYRKNELPIPRRHPDIRHLDRMTLRNPRKLFDRKCDKCGKDIKTTYSPDRKEIVYCENCYEKEVY